MSWLEWYLTLWQAGWDALWRILIPLLFLAGAPIFLVWLVLALRHESAGERFIRFLCWLDWWYREVGRFR